MPSLVARKKTKQSEAGSPQTVWEVRAMYLPFFLAADQTLMVHLDSRLRQFFKGERIFEGDTSIEKRMTEVVTDAILEKHPIKGLREVLQAIAEMTPNEMLLLHEIPNLDPPPSPEEEKADLQVVSLEETLEEGAA